MWKILIYVIATFIMASCGEIVDSRVVLNEHYFIDAVDIDKNRSLYYSIGDGSGVGRVSNGVIAVGLDEKHIIIKQRIDDTDRYYILDMSKDSETAKPEDSVYGPYSMGQFSDARSKLNVQDTLIFSHSF